MDVGFPNRGQIVVLPSMTIDIPEPMRTALGRMVMTREERLLCLLLLLRHPAVSLVYVSSVAPPPSVVRYWLDHLPDPDARNRLTLFALDDESPEPLSRKLLDNAGALDRLRACIPDPSAAYLLPFHAHELDERVATALGIPMFGVTPELAARFGSKSGARAVFAACGVPHPAGVCGIHTVDEIVGAVRSIAEGRPGERRWVVKQDHGGGGHGNALVTVDGALSAAEVRERVSGLRPDEGRASSEWFLARFAQIGGVVEEWIAGQEVRSPSAQLRIDPNGAVAVCATHEQVLGGATGQSYVGCRFPADSQYAGTIADIAVRVGRYLADQGVIGHLGIDFVVTRSRGADWQAFALEINPRLTGTFHHFEALRLLTAGVYDAEAGSFRLPDGSSRYYVGSDDLPVDGVESLGAEDVARLLAGAATAWDADRRCGILLHTISALAIKGTVGVTAIGESPDEAESLHRTAGPVLVGPGRH